MSDEFETRCGRCGKFDFPFECKCRWCGAVLVEMPAPNIVPLIASKPIPAVVMPAAKKTTARKPVKSKRGSA